MSDDIEKINEIFRIHEEMVSGRAHTEPEEQAVEQDAVDESLPETVTPVEEPAGPDTEPGSEEKLSTDEGSAAEESPVMEEVPAAPAEPAAAPSEHAKRKHGKVSPSFHLTFLLFFSYPY